MDVLRRLFSCACALAAAALLVLTVVSAVGPLGQPPPEPLPGMERWDVSQLAQHLWDRGSSIRLLTVDNPGVATNGAFLTTTGKGWAELNGLPKLSEAIDRWEGTVYCE